jgi:tetratricopeptide (TPR) repeat protein
MAGRLGVPIEHLLRGVTSREYDEMKLTLDFAELSLESGQHLEAENQARQALDRAVAGSQEDLAYRARYLIARALEGQGNRDDAIVELEGLVYSRQGGLLRIKSAIAMVRCLKDSGDLTAAIEVGERVMAQLVGSYIESCDESVQLSMTVAAAYFLRGDSGHAVRMCRKAIVKAEQLASPTARASAYWNASVFEAQRGSATNAVPLAARALSLLSEGQDSRNLARLRSALGSMQLELDPPEVPEALEHLTKAAEELVWTSASPTEIQRNNLAIARAHFLDGDLATAGEMCSAIISAVEGEAPVTAAHAESLAGQVLAASGDSESAKRAYRRAVLLLTGVGADKDAAQLWFELADLLEEVGDLDAARDAYRSAAAASGLRVRAKSRTDVLQR